MLLHVTLLFTPHLLQTVGSNRVTDYSGAVGIADASTKSNLSTRAGDRRRCDRAWRESALGEERFVTACIQFADTVRGVTSSHLRARKLCILHGGFAGEHRPARATRKSR